MPHRTAKFVSTIFACFLSGAAVATLSSGAARAADDCLAAPKDETPEGSHWYYRIDHATNRHCWYLREEGDKLAQTAPPNSSRPTNPVASNTETSTLQSIANAHAELPAQTSIEPPMKPLTAIPADAAAGYYNGVAPDAQAQRSVVASRWPDASDVNSSGASSAVSPPPAMERLAANLSSNPATASPAAAVPLAATDPSSQGQPRSIAMLLSVIAGALALAGITASLVVKFGGARRPRQPKLRLRRGVNWEPTDDDSIELSDHRADDVLPRRSGFPRDLDQPEDANERIAEFFAQLSRRAPS
jgi:hypothetical protein